MILAIFGSSGTGKTAVARQFASELGWTLRCCGEVVRRKALDLAVSPAALPVDAHVEIDSETRKAAAAVSPLIVEGRFLDYVFLNESISELVLVRLDAFPETRLSRVQYRSGAYVSQDYVDCADKEDIDFVRAMYPDVLPLTPDLSIQTDKLTVAGVVACLQNRIRNRS